MRSSILLGLGAVLSMAVATAETNTLYATTTVTVVHCEPTHTDCIGGSVTILTTVSSTECLTTSTPAPIVTPSYPASPPPVVESSASTPAPVSTSEVSSSVVEVPSSTAEVPNSTAEVPSSTAEVPGMYLPLSKFSGLEKTLFALLRTWKANFYEGSTAVTSSTAEGVPSSTSIQTGSTEVLSTLTTVASESPSYVPVTTLAYSNTSEPLLTATGTPTTTTAVVVTTPATNYSPTAPGPSATQTGASAAANVVVPGLTLGLLALGAYLFG
ncbi:hypothetical protein BKA65DRAFT_230395 [Rhexocercosporidium sp. MPI-PUGE-AT-0058]|nr:hypothetical protein BKA65DRAFT_230395 [Rhexocercosporidium sp. MPI-PUGE-AT-0058]